MELYYENIKDKNFVEKLDGKVVMDFITVNTGSVKDWTIFMNWASHFHKLKSPFVITEDIRTRSNKLDDIYRTLWVEEKAPPMLNGAKERIEIVFDISKNNIGELKK